MALETSASEAVANNAVLTLVTRGVQLIGIPIGLWLLYSAGGALDTLRIDMAALKASIATRVETAQARESLQDNRIATIEGLLLHHP